MGLIRPYLHAYISMDEYVHQSILSPTQTMIQLLTPIIFFIVLYIFWNVYSHHKTKRSKINLPPGSFGWPFLGESLALLRACWDGVPERFVEERIEKHDSPLGSSV
ncbi:hypothetical protein Hdeb2414_s0020g00552881 [Helianthus debilis subsp. tardiflorus]